MAAPYPANNTCHMPPLTGVETTNGPRFEPHPEQAV